MCARLVSEFRRHFADSGMTPDLVRDFQNEVMEFYETKGRHDMEWRLRFDPYRIVVSEVMLQQTQVPRVAVIYPKFIEKFPDFAALAEAPQAELLAAWQEMGYNSRALRLQKLARQVVDEYGGVLPQEPELLEQLPGIGPATSCSIAAFAFNRPVVFIETNVRRVFIHYFFADDAVVDDRELFPLVSACLLLDRSREWYWALMDLGTALKSSVPNPNRRSRQYVKQSAFEGSDRQVRGAVLRTILANDGKKSQEIALDVGEPQERVEKILDEMCSEGFFVQEEGGSYRVQR